MKTSGEQKHADNEWVYRGSFQSKTCSQRRHLWEEGVDMMDAISCVLQATRA